MDTCAKKLCAIVSLCAIFFIEPLHKDSLKSDIFQKNAHRSEEISLDIPHFFQYSFWGCLIEVHEKKLNYSKEFCEGEVFGLREELFLVKGRDGLIPTVQVSRVMSEPSSKFSKIVVYIVGGPLRSYPRITEIPEAYKDLDSETLIVFPIHIGSFFRSSGDAVGDLKNGKLEIEEFVADLRNRFPDAKFFFIGESWGGFFASRVEKKKYDTIIFLSSPVNHSGTSLANYFSLSISKRKQTIDTTRAWRLDDPYKQISINRFDYVNSALISIGDEPFVLPRGMGDASCRVIVYGKKDPMLKGFDRPDGYSEDRREWVLSRNTGHDTLAGFEGFFRRITDYRCT